MSSLGVNTLMNYSVVRRFRPVALSCSKCPAFQDTVPFHEGGWLRWHLRVVVKECIYLQAENLYLFHSVLKQLLYLDHGLCSSLSCDEISAGICTSAGEQRVGVVCLGCWDLGLGKWEVERPGISGEKAKQRRDCGNMW